MSPDRKDIFKADGRAAYKGKNKGETRIEVVWYAAIHTKLSLAAGTESKAVFGRWGRWSF